MEINFPKKKLKRPVVGSEGDLVRTSVLPPKNIDVGHVC